MSGLVMQLKQYRLTTAEILYHMPDHPSLLQSYLWQEYDLAPQFPTLRKFLDFWSHNLDGKLHSVKVASVDLLTPPKWRNAQELLTLAHEFRTLAGLRQRLAGGTIAYFSNHTADTSATLMVAVDFAVPTAPKVLWNTPTGERIGASHVLHEGLLYLAGGRCLAAATGATVYENQAGKACYSSLALAGGLLFQFGKKQVDIWKPGRQFQSVAKMDHGFNDFIASPVFAGKVLYFRDAAGLHCIGGG